jgi:hypothetical protein
MNMKRILDASQCREKGKHKGVKEGKRAKGDYERNMRNA